MTSVWIVIDINEHVLGEYETYGEALEAASVLETYGLRCDIKEIKEKK